MTNLYLRPFLVAVVGLGVLAGSAIAQPTRSGEKPGKAGRIVLDRVVAVINNEVIFESEVEARVQPLLGDLKNIADPRERARRAKKLESQLLEEMISDELMVQAAHEAKLAVEDKEIEAAVDEVKKQNNLDDAGLEEALSLQGFSVATYRRDVERQILRMRSINTLVRPRVTITDEDVRARYDEMNRRSAAVSKVRLMHILLSLPPKPPEQDVARAKAQAAEIIERVKQGTPFAELASQYSDDQATKDSGGDLGWIERGSLATEWEVIVFAMDKGEVRGPINGPSGLHVFYVSDIKKTEVKPFAEVKEQLRNELFRKEMEKQTATWLDELRKKAHIERKL